MASLGKIARRTFLIGTAAIAGGVAVGYYFYQKPFANPLEDDLAEGEAAFNPYVKIAQDGVVTVIVPRSEMGQGVSTTLAALVAEELDLELDQIRVQAGPAAFAYANIAVVEDQAPFPRYDNSTLAEILRGALGVIGKLVPIEGTGGSSSAVDAFDRMRLAGATAREMLKQAAATRLGVDRAALVTGGGLVTDPGSGKSLGYGELAAAAASGAPPADIELRPRDMWRLLGKPQRRTDMLAKVTGAPIYGIDVSLPDMIFATLRMNPRLGGKVNAIDASAAERLPGVIKIVPVESHIASGFGVLATSTWHAFRAADAVKVEWGAAPYPADDAAIFGRLTSALAESGFALRSDGDVETEFADAPRDRVIEANYAAPFLAHAAMEPINVTARLRDGVLDIWAPTQVQTLGRMLAADAAGLETEACRVHTTFLGGGFGRRLDADDMLHATMLAMAAPGRPVKMTWTREEDITHDVYRPAAVARMRARLDEIGLPQALEIKVASPSILASMLSRFLPAIPAVGPDPTIIEGAFNQPYEIPNYRVAAIKTEIGIPIGMWRSVGNSFNCFFHECFLDEIADAGAIDPIDLRRRLMSAFPVALGVVEKVAAMSGWGTPLATGRARGFAFSLTFGGWVAQVVEISDTPSGIRIENVWIAADIGIVLDPAIVEAQLISGAVFGLSSAIGQEINFADGMVRQSNFHDFDAMRISSCPRFEVALLENSPVMSGVGEMGTPAVIPALVNAVFALTGKRIRTLPLSREVSFA